MELKYIPRLRQYLRKNIHSLVKLISSQCLSSLATNVGDEGGFAPELFSIEECLNLIVEAIKIAGYDGKVKIGLDVAASGTSASLISYFYAVEFYENGLYNLSIKDPKCENPVRYTSEELGNFYLNLLQKFPSTFVIFYSSDI